MYRSRRPRMTVCSRFDAFLLRPACPRISVGRAGEIFTPLAGSCGGWRGERFVDPVVFARRNRIAAPKCLVTRARAPAPHVQSTAAACVVLDLEFALYR